MKIAAKNKKLQFALLLLVFWLMPTLIYFFAAFTVVQREQRYKNAAIQEEINQSLSRLVYEARPNLYFQPIFDGFFAQIKGLTATNKKVSEQLTKEFGQQYGKGAFSLFLFNSAGQLMNSSENKDVYELFYRMATDNNFKYTLNKDIYDKLGKVFPTPDVLCRNISKFLGTLSDTNIPDVFSSCYINVDKNFDEQSIAGIMIFINKKNLPSYRILKELIKDGKEENFGYISQKHREKGGILLPNLLSDFTPEEIISKASMSTMSFFTLGKNIVSLRFLDSETSLLATFPHEEVAFKTIGIAFFLYLLFTFATFKIIAYFTMLPPNAASMRKKLAALMFYSYLLPLSILIFASIQYLEEFKFSLEGQVKEEAVERLSELDSGFQRYLKEQIIENRKISEFFNENSDNLEMIKNFLTEERSKGQMMAAFVADKESKLLFRTNLGNSEVIRYKGRSKYELQDLLRTWEKRGGSVEPRLIKALGEEIPYEESPEDLATGNVMGEIARLVLKNLYKNYCLANNIPTVQDSSFNFSIFLEGVLEVSMQTSFYAAGTNIGKFTEISAPQASYLVYPNVIVAKDGTPHYSYMLFYSLLALEHNYLDRIYMTLSEPDLASDHPEDIRAISDYKYAENKPTLFEFETFDSILRRSKSELNTFSEHMTLNGEEVLITVLKPAFLKHYLLLKITKLSEMKAMVKKKSIRLAALFATLIIASSILLIITWKTIVQPVDELLNFTENFHGKSEPVKIHNRSNNEFDEITDAFSEALAALETKDLRGEVKKYLYPFEKELRCGTYNIVYDSFSTKLLPSDFLDFMPLVNGNYAIIMAKITGNNSSAVYLMTLLKTAFRLLCPDFPEEPETILQKLNSLIIPYHGKGHMVTCLIGILDPINDTMYCANAGYTYPVSLLLHANEKHFVSLPSAPLGINPKAVFKKHKVNLVSRTIVFYSEGAVDRKDMDNNSIGHEKFMQLASETLSSNYDNPAERIKDVLVEAGDISFNTEDITVAVLKSII
ncbi:MAG: serine/threonine-protein phosphatase [Candidatus Riflebacteria bacterium]|nr:serine/threonine-protein phosphatase [Candidatus Riflebacteria bacterium]